MIEHTEIDGDEQLAREGYERGVLDERERCAKIVEGDSKKFIDPEATRAGSSEEHWDSWETIRRGRATENERLREQFAKIADSETCGFSNCTSPTCVLARKIAKAIREEKP